MAIPKGSKNKVKPHKYTPEEKAYLYEIIPGHSYKEIQYLFYKKFKINLTTGQVKGVVGRSGVNTGRTGRFEKGKVSWNKGLKQEEYMSKEAIERSKKTRFKKGIIPGNKRELGSDRLNVDGYWEIKVAEPNKWMLKQRFIWELYTGEKLTTKDNILFLDHNKNNIDITNLVKITNAQLALMNGRGLIKNDADLTLAGVNIARLIEKIREVENNGQ